MSLQTFSATTAAGGCFTAGPTPTAPFALPFRPRPPALASLDGPQRIFAEAEDTSQHSASAADGTSLEGDSSINPSPNPSLDELEGFALPWAATTHHSIPTTSTQVESGLVGARNSDREQGRRLQRRGDGDIDFGPGDYGWGELAVSLLAALVADHVRLCRNRHHYRNRDRPCVRLASRTTTTSSAPNSSSSLQDQLRPRIYHRLYHVRRDSTHRRYRRLCDHLGVRGWVKGGELLRSATS